MAELRLDGARLFVGPVGADPKDLAGWTEVVIDSGSITVGDPTGKHDDVVWSANAYPQPDGWDWAAWMDLRTGESGPLVEVEPTSVVDAPIDDAPQPSSPDR